MQALFMLEKYGKSDFEEKAFKLFLNQALKISEKGADAKSLQCLAFYCHLASSMNLSGWRKRMQKLLKVTGWVDPAEESLYDADLGRLALPCDSVPGDTVEKRSNTQLEVAKKVIMQDQEPSQESQSLTLLLSLASKGSPIRPRKFNPDGPLSRVLQTLCKQRCERDQEDMRAAVTPVKGAKSRQDQQERQRAVAAKQAGKQSQQDEPTAKQVLAALEDELIQQGQAAACSLLTITVDDLRNKVEEIYPEEDALAKEALAYWLQSEGLPYGYAGIDKDASFLHPAVVDDSLKAHLMLPRTESLKAQLGHLFGSKVPTDDAMAEYSRQAMQGEGFLHQGQLPSELPKLHIGLAPSSCQSEKATTMLPLTGRDPSLVEAVKEFQDALLIARHSGVLLDYADFVELHREERGLLKHFEISLETLKMEISTAEFGSSPYTKRPASMGFSFMESGLMGVRVRLEGREGQTSEETLLQLSARGLHLLQLIQCYGRLCLLQSTSGQLLPGDKLLVQTMKDSLAVLSADEGPRGPEGCSILKIIGGPEATLDTAGRQSWLRWQRFPCHLLGPDADSPVADSLVRIEEESLCCEVEEDRGHRQRLLDIIIDALWILKRNKLLTSGFVYSIAVHMMMTISKDRGLCSVHSFAWEDLGQLKLEALQIIAHSVCAQLGLCQELVREYADARLMIAQAESLVLGKEGDVAVAHLKCVPVSREHSAAYAASQLRSICKRSLDTVSGVHQVEREKERETWMVIDYVQALYKETESLTPWPPRPVLQHMTTSQIETCLDLSIGCLDQALFWRTSAGALGEDHKEYLHACADFLRKASEMVADGGMRKSYREGLWKAFCACRDASAAFHKSLEATIHKEASLLNLRKAAAKSAPLKGISSENDNTWALCEDQQSDMEVKEALLQADVLKSRCKEEMQQIPPLRQDLTRNLAEFFAQLERRQDPEKNKELTSDYMQKLVLDILQNIFLLEVRGVHLVDIKMEAARLVALMDLRVIKSCSENCIPSYLEEAAVLCLKDKLMAFAANQSERKMAAEQEEHRLKEERSRQQADELLEELEEEERKEAEIKRMQEEKKRKKAKANAKNAKLEEERAARDRAEQEAAAQRDAGKERTREQERKAAEELQAKEQQFRRMQEQLLKDAGASQPAVIVSSPGKIPRVKEIPVPLEPRPKQAVSSKDRRGGREDHGSQASSCGRGTQEEGAPEANGHASTAGSHGGDTSQGAMVVRKQGSRSRPDGGAAKDGFSAESRHPGKEALQSGTIDRSDGNQGRSSQQQPSADHSRNTSNAERGASRCWHCRDPGRGVADCPKLEGIETEHQSAIVSAHLAGNRMKAEGILHRQQAEKPPSSRSGRRGSRGKSADLPHCLHCKLEDHRTMTCPALATLSQDARAQINQAYLGCGGDVDALLKKYLADNWSLSLRDAARCSKVDTSEQPEGSCCALCLVPGHRVEGCPVAKELPQNMLHRVVDLASSQKRHFALNLIIAHWKHNGGTPKDVPYVKSLRQRKFCCHCDADSHRTTGCPELKDLDFHTRKHLDHAYTEGTWQGKSPEQLYDEWLQEHSDKHAVTCALCTQQHSVEDCHQLNSLPLSTFNQIVETCRGGDVGMAMAMLESLKLDPRQAGAAASEPSQGTRPEAAAPAKEQQSAQALQLPQRASSTSQEARAEVQPLKPGFWKSMKLPSRDPPVGGIRVRTDMANDCFQQCLHCLSKAHSFKECPELKPLTESGARSLQHAYKDRDLQRARRVVEMALGCRMCRRDKHWIANCPRVPKHIRSEIEEIYSKGPVEAAVKLANNALQSRLLVPSASHAPPSTVGPAGRSQAAATTSAPSAQPPVNWAAAVKRGIDQDQQVLSQAEGPPAVIQSAPCPEAAAPESTADESTVERPEEEDPDTKSAESLQDVKASKGVGDFLADAPSQSDMQDGSEAGESSSGPQPVQLTVPGGKPFSPQQHSPARRIILAPHPMSSGGPYTPQQSPPRPFPSAHATLSSLAPPVPPVPPHLQPPAAQPPSATWSSRSTGAVPSAGNPIGYRPWVPSPIPALQSQAAATLPALNGLFPAPAQARLPPPGFPQVRQEEARVQNHLDLEAAMRVFGAADRPSAASTRMSSPQLPHLPRSQPPAAAPSQSLLLQPGALHGLGAQQLPMGRHARGPAVPIGAQPPETQQPNSDEYILGLLGIGGPKPASQQQQQASSVPQPSSVFHHDGGQSESEDASEYSDYEPPGAQPQAYWQRPGGHPVSPARKPVQQGAWCKPLGAAVFVDSPQRSAPASAGPSPSKPVPHGFPEAARSTALVPHQTDEEQSESEEDDEEEEELNAAIQASLQDQHTQQGLGVMQEAAMMEDGASQHLALVAHVPTPGLQNLTGEYNCFLNVIVQCLWHCMAFRSGMLHRLDPEQLEGVPVVRELLGLFRAFAREEAQRSNPEAHRPATIAPNALREALHDLNADLFSVGEMSDAAEVLNAVYDSLGEVPGGPELVDSVFGLRVRELVHCRDCGRDTHEASYTQSFYNVSATALRLQALIMDPDDDAPSLGQALREVEGQTLKSCDTDRGGCGRDQQVRFFLEGTPPAAFTLQLAWERNQESAADIRDTMATIQETVDLGEVYLGQPKGRYIYRLRSMVCYYGAHYHAFVHTAGGWIMFDDANTSVVGNWDAVLHKCQLGKIQPSVLFFERSVSVP
ncbi:g9865 [Coccomyxa elongata]